MYPSSSPVSWTLTLMTVTLSHVPQEPHSDLSNSPLKRITLQKTIQIIFLTICGWCPHSEMYLIFSPSALFLLLTLMFKIYIKASEIVKALSVSITLCSVLALPSRASMAWFYSLATFQTSYWLPYYLLFVVIIIIACVFVWVSVLWYWGQRTICRRQFSPSTTWIPGI